MEVLLYNKHIISLLYLFGDTIIYIMFRAAVEDNEWRIIVKFDNLMCDTNKNVIIRSEINFTAINE